MATLHKLPPTPVFDSVRNLLHGTVPTPRADVLFPTTTNDQVIKTRQLVFQNGSNLIFANITWPFIAVYADDWYFDGPFNVGYSSNLNLDGADGPPPVPTPPTPPGWGKNGNNGVTGSRGHDGSPAPALPQILFFGQRAFLGEPDRSVMARPRDVPGPF